jgi:phage terminase large subunit
MFVDFHTKQPVNPSPRAFTIGNQVLFDPMPGAQVEFTEAQETNVFIYGNRGGGKSILARNWCHGMAMANPGLVYVIVRKSYPELNLNHLMYLDDEMELLGGSYNSSEHMCFYHNGSIGVYRQCASEADMKKVVGAEASILVFDEAPELEWGWIRLMGASVRVKRGSGLKPKVRYLGNPIGPAIDDLWSYFIDKDVDRLADPHYNPADWKAIEIKMQDNVHLDVEEYQKQFAGIPEHIRKAWVDGIRVVNGAYFVVDPKRHHTLSVPHLLGEVDRFGFVTRAPHIYRVIDWGWHDEAVCLWVALYPTGRAIVFKEFVVTHMTARSFGEEIVSRSQGMKIRDTFCDPSIFPPAGSDVRLPGNILEDECHISLTKSRNDRAVAGHAISEWLNTNLQDGLPAIQIYTPGCPYLTKTLPQMRMDPNDPNKIADGKDHAVIALSYFCIGETIAPQNMQTAPTATRTSNLIHRIPRPQNVSIFKGIGVRK